MQHVNPKLGESLVAGEYVRSRLAPEPGEQFYLTLSDLALAWRKVAQQLAGSRPRIIDLGCGGSPYRDLFGDAACYHRADVEGVPDLVYTMDPRTGHTGAAEGGYDVVVSSQVLEHVENPASYLAEAARLLRAGGTLVLSTHGAFQDHPCPGDYWRWTGQGLEKTLNAAGFEVQDMLHLTTGPRGALGFLELNMPQLPLARGWLMRVLSYWPRRIWGSRCFRRWLHRMVDEAFPGSRAVDELPPFGGLYFVLFATARKR